MMGYACPVCGYSDLTEVPQAHGLGGSYEICPSCGFQFGVTDDDRGFTYDEWRTVWIKNGMPWTGVGIPPPAGWDPAIQLSAVARAQGSFEVQAYRVPYGLILRVDLHLFRRDEGGLRLPISSGYRPLCILAGQGKQDVTVGMCQVEVSDGGEISPGQTAPAVLGFAPGVAENVRELVRVGSEIKLVEGDTAIGTAKVEAVAE
jgi:hypothetical protein